MTTTNVRNKQFRHRPSRAVVSQASGLAQFLDTIGDFLENRRVAGLKRKMINLSPDAWVELNAAFPDQMGSAERRQLNKLIEEYRDVVELQGEGLEFFLTKEEITDFDERFEGYHAKLGGMRARLVRLEKRIKKDERGLTGLSYLVSGDPLVDDNPNPEQETATEETSD